VEKVERIDFIRQSPLVLEGGFEKSHIENILDGFLWDSREPRLKGLITPPSGGRGRGEENVII
jgi:hypothetical protein